MASDTAAMSGVTARRRQIRPHIRTRRLAQWLVLWFCRRFFVGEDPLRCFGRIVSWGIVAYGPVNFIVVADAMRGKDKLYKKTRKRTTSIGREKWIEKSPASSLAP